MIYLLLHYAHGFIENQIFCAPQNLLDSTYFTYFAYVAKLITLKLKMHIFYMKLVLKVKRDIMNGFQGPNRRNYSFAMKQVCDLFQVKIAVKIPRKTAIQRRAQHSGIYP